MSKSALNCALTIIPDQQIQAGALLSNGFGQNVLFKYQLLELLGHRPFLISENPPKTGKYQIKGRTYEVRQTSAVVNGSDPVDIAFEGSQNIGVQRRETMKSKWGTRIVSLRYGNNMIMDMENTFVGDYLKETTVYTSEPDMVWTSPHFIDSVSYMEVIFKSPVRIAPYVWEPQFVTKERFSLDSYPEKPIINVMESNVHVMKNALIPMAVIERVYRDDPDLFDIANIYNALVWNNKPYFLNNVVKNMSSMDARANKVWFNGRKSFDEIFQKPDILLGHQWQCELNYLYLEALHVGVPLIHNSPPFEEVGYYYPRFEVGEGAEQIGRAIKEGFSAMWNEEGRKKIEDVIHHYSITNEQVQQSYQSLIDEVMSL